MQELLDWKKKLIDDYGLAFHVKDILIFEEKVDDKIHAIPFFADGYPGIMFQQTEKGVVLKPQNKFLSEIFLYGLTIIPNMLHAIRHGLDNDGLFRSILRGINKTFYHKTVTSQQIENYISQKAKYDYSKVFDQYLRTIYYPDLEIFFTDNKQKIFYRYANCVPGFNMPLTLKNNETKLKLIPTPEWNSLVLKANEVSLFDKPAIEKMYYITVAPVENPDPGKFK